MITMVSLDSIAHEGVELGEQSQVSKSILGRGVRVGKRCKISNCVILNNVVVGNE